MDEGTSKFGTYIIQSYKCYTHDGSNKAITAHGMMTVSPQVSWILNSTLLAPSWHRHDTVLITGLVALPSCYIFRAIIFNIS